MAPASGVESVLRALQSGSELKGEAIVVLSDLDRDGSDMLRALWPSIPPARRIWAMERALDRFLGTVEVDFSRLGLIAIQDDEERVRLAAVLALSESETREAAEQFLRTSLHDPADSVREAAVAELGRFVLLAEVGSFSRSMGDRIETELRALAADSNLAIEVRAAAVEALGPSTKPWIEALINDAYYSDAREMRLSAVTAMGRSADEAWLEFVIEQLHSDDPEFRIEAAVACGEIASPDALEGLTELLVDEDPEVRFAAIAAVGDIGGNDAVAILDEFKLDADEEMHEAIDLARQNASEIRSRAAAEDGEEW